MKKLSNIIEFPTNRSFKMEQAIRAVDAGDDSMEIADEFRSLANDGYSEADYFLGCMYEDGINGLSKDLPTALKHYKKAADEIGYLEAYLAQAKLLYYGDGGIEKDLDEAKRIYELVKDYDQHFIACFMLGRMYQYGEGVKKDLNEAERLYNMAIEQGSIYGMLNLARLYADKKMYFSSLFLRIKAGIRASIIHYKHLKSGKNLLDPRLRGG